MMSPQGMSRVVYTFVEMLVLIRIIDHIGLWFSW